MSDGTLLELLEGAARSGRGVCFVDARERDAFCSYAAILESARATGGGLQKLGVRPGDRVAIVLPTGPDFFDAFFGALYAGAVPVPLYPPVRLGRLDEYHERTAAMLRASRARRVLTDARTRRVLGPSVERAAPELGCRATARIPGAEPAPVEVAADDAAFIQFSSGTTAAPKPVLLSHRGVRANVAAILQRIRESCPEEPQRPHVCVSWLPLYHDMGLVGAVLAAMGHPGDLVLIPPELFVARPAVWLRAISRHRGTISPAPNFAYALCADRVGDDEIAALDLSSWRVAMNGAEPVTPAVLERFLSRFAACGLRPEALTPVYGLAEATLAVTFSDLSKPFRHTVFDRDALLDEGRARVAAHGSDLVSLGPPLPGFEVRIASDAGDVLAAGRVGHVQVRGPSLMQGYDGLPEPTRRALRDGWLATGDVGFLHEGELYLCSRAKDVIVLRGRNHAPQDVEQAVSEVAGTRTGCVAAVGMLAPRGDGEELAVFAERTRGSRAADLIPRIERQVLRRTGIAPGLVRVLEPGTLPRTSSGKIRRAETLRLHELGALRPPANVSALSLTRAMVRSTLAFARMRRRA
ncbi:MAG: fatty acyl-AMP ligase [Myxococcota bacterium]